MKNNRSRHAQNPIAYIVYNDPKGTRRLIDERGYEPPGDPHDLVAVTKQLVRKEGQGVVKELLALHPDKNAILSLEKGQEDSYCGACNSHAYDAEQKAGCGHASYTGTQTESFLKQLVDMSVLELERLYQTAVQKANQAPLDNHLAEEVRLIWNELRLRKQETPTDQLTEEKPEPMGIRVQPKEALLILGLTLVAGGLIGCSLSRNAA